MDVFIRHYDWVCSKTNHRVFLILSNSFLILNKKLILFRIVCTNPLGPEIHLFYSIRYIDLQYISEVWMVWTLLKSVTSKQASMFFFCSSTILSGMLLLWMDVKLDAYIAGKLNVRSYIYIGCTRSSTEGRGWLCVQLRIVAFEPNHLTFSALS